MLEREIAPTHSIDVAPTLAYYVYRCILFSIPEPTLMQLQGPHPLFSVFSTIQRTRVVAKKDRELKLECRRGWCLLWQTTTSRASQRFVMLSPRGFLPATHWVPTRLTLSVTTARHEILAFSITKPLSDSECRSSVMPLKIWLAGR